MTMIIFLHGPRQARKKKKKKKKRLRALTQCADFRHPAHAQSHPGIRPQVKHSGISNDTAS